MNHAARSNAIQERKRPPPTSGPSLTQHSLFKRVDDPIKGRHLVATQMITKGQLLFIERPLLAFQSIQNLHYNRYICYNCKAFVNTPANMLLWRCRQSSTTMTTNETDATESLPIDTTMDSTVQPTVLETDQYYCIPCRHACGYVYCSNQCEMTCWNKHHQYLCTGDKESSTHPIVQYKQYAIETNEVLLLIAEWWISQHTTITSNTISDTINERSEEELYTDFIMNPWWDVVTSDMIQDVNEPSAGYINGEVITIHDQLKVVCTTAAELLNHALGHTNNDCDINQQNVSGMHTIPKITALDIACRIGAMEQNAMGIRQRSPLCSPTMLADKDFRHKYHKLFLQCIHETGFMDRNNDQVCDDDVEDENGDVVATMNSDDSTLYSYDDVALRLSKLFMNEDFSVNDTNPNGGNDTNTSATNSKNMTDIESIMYNTDGDDLDILFPPLDGTAMYSMACKMNHSCHPNVILLYRRRSNIGPAYPLVAMVVALRQIEPQEELTISYINANAPFRQRQKDLQNYGFTCHCMKCELEKDAMVEDDEEDSDDDDDEGEDDDDMEDSKNLNSTLDSGELKLQERIERLDSIVNHSLFGRIPSNCYDPVLNYIVQTTNLLLSTNDHRDLLLVIHQSKTDEKAHVATAQTVIITLLESCFTAIQNHDYSLCKIVGCDLEATLLQQQRVFANVQDSEQSVETKSWPTLAHREAYFCSALVACIGYCHDYDFITAEHCIDRALEHGLPRQCVEDFVQYIETFASQMQSSIS